MSRVIAQLADGVQLVVLQHSDTSFSAVVLLGAWPGGKQLAMTAFDAGVARVDTNYQPPSLWLGKTNIEVPWLELLKVADFLHIDIPLPHPPEGTAVQS